MKKEVTKKMKAMKTTILILLICTAAASVYGANRSSGIVSQNTAVAAEQSGMSVHEAEETEGVGAGFDIPNLDPGM